MTWTAVVDWTYWNKIHNSTQVAGGTKIQILNILRLNYSTKIGIKEQNLLVTRKNTLLRKGETNVTIYKGSISGASSPELLTIQKRKVMTPGCSKPQFMRTHTGHHSMFMMLEEIEIRDHFVNAPSQRYIVASSLIGWAHSQNDPWEITLVQLNLV